MLRIIIYLVTLIFQLSAQAATQESQVDHYFYQDTRNDVTIDSVSNVQFKPYSGTLRLGYPSGSTWVRLKINAPAASIHNPLILRVGPHYLDHIEVYQPVEGGWSRETAGDLYKKINPLCADDTHCFTLQPLPDPDDFIYLKV